MIAGRAEHENAERYDAKIAEGRTRIAALRDADVHQEGTVRDLPAKTAAFYLAKGELYLQLKRLSRRGRHRFANEAARARAYRLALRAPRSGARSGAEPEAPPTA